MPFGLILNIMIAVLGALVTATANLTDIFGPALAKLIVSTCGLTLLVLSAIAGAVSKYAGAAAQVQANQIQSLSNPVNQVKAVAALPGVDEIKTNLRAAPEIKKLAADPAQEKIT